MSFINVIIQCQRLVSTVTICLARSCSVPCGPRIMEKSVLILTQLLSWTSTAYPPRLKYPTLLVRWTVVSLTFKITLTCIIVLKIVSSAIEHADVIQDCFSDFILSLIRFSPAGRPFQWAQRLAGITGWSVDAKLDVARSRATVPHFLEAIKQRCLARLALKYQLR